MLYRREQRGPNSGAAAAELAILLPLLTFLMLMTVDFARICYSAMTITNCARNGALWACDPSTQAQSPYKTLAAAAQADATNLSPLPTVDALKYSPVANGPYGATPVTDGYVEVTVNWTFSTIVPYPGIPSTTALSRSVRMRIIP